MRREVLSDIGGFKSIANQLADDYRLGELTRRAGLRTVLSDVVVETFVSETTVTELVRHELRWLRTIRAVRPLGYGFAFLDLWPTRRGVGKCVGSRVHSHPWHARYDHGGQMVASPKDAQAGLTAVPRAPFAVERPLKFRAMGLELCHASGAMARFALLRRS